MEVMGFLATSVGVVELEAVVLVWVVQVAAALEEAWAEVLEEAQAEVMAPAAVMAPVVALEVASVEVLVLAPETWEEATVPDSAVASNRSRVSSP